MGAPISVVIACANSSNRSLVILSRLFNSFRRSSLVVFEYVLKASFAAATALSTSTWFPKIIVPT